MTLTTHRPPVPDGPAGGGRERYRPGPVLARPGRPPTVRLCAAPDSAPVAAAIGDALSLLVAAGRLGWADPDGPADLLHTVGTVGTTGIAADDAAHRVHTVHRIPLRPGPKPAAARWWVLRERCRSARGTLWLTHGRTAARMVVEAGLAPGERVRCLPLLPPWRPDPAVEQGLGDPARRVALRRELGVRPGMRLVVGVSERFTCDGVDAWPSAVVRLRRTDVRVLHATGRGHPTVALPLLLAAADLVVATGRELSASSAAVPALAAGVPVVAVTTDPAAELVEAGRTGLVVAPRLDAVVEAIVAHLDGRAPSWRREQDPPVRAVGHELARYLLPAYGEALTRSSGRVRVR